MSLFLCVGHVIERRPIQGVAHLVPWHMGRPQPRTALKDHLSNILCKKHGRRQ